MPVTDLARMPAPVTSPIDLPAPSDIEQWMDLSLNAPGGAVRERAAAEYEVLRRQYTSLGAAFLKWTDRRTPERAWRVGASGEVRVGRILDRLPAPAFRVLHSVPVGRGESDIDHVVLRPPGVITVNTKRHPDARVWVGGNCVKVNGCNHPYVRNSRFEAQRTARLLGAALGWEPPVRAALVFDTTGGVRLTIKAPPDDLAILSHREVRSWLLGLPAALSVPQQTQVFEVARRSTTWSCGATRG